MKKSLAMSVIILGLATASLSFAGIPYNYDRFQIQMHYGNVQASDLAGSGLLIGGSVTTDNSTWKGGRAINLPQDEPNRVYDWHGGGSVENENIIEETIGGIHSMNSSILETDYNSCDQFLIADKAPNFKSYALDITVTPKGDHYLATCSYHH